MFDSRLKTPAARRRIARIGISAAVLSSAAFLVPPATNAVAASSACDTTEPSTHCYAIVEIDNSAPVQHWSTHVDFSCANVFTNYSYEFIDNELWAMVDGTSSGGTYWVESGLKAYSDGIEWFWADNRKGAGYTEHDGIVSAGPRTDYATAIHYDGGSKYEIQVSQQSSPIGYSTSGITGPSLGAQAGIEGRYNDEAGVGYANGLKYEKNGSSTLYNSWGSHSYTQTESNNSWPYHAVLSADRYNASAYTDDCNNNIGPYVKTRTKTEQPRALASTTAAVAQDWATLNGDANATVVSKTLASARQASVAADTAGGDTVPATGESVDTYELTGNFTGLMASTPAGSPPPTGTTLIVSVNRSTNLITDWSMPSKRVTLG